MLVGLNYKGKKIKIEVKKFNFFGKFIGLMFSRREKAPALLFDFEKPTNQAIHSLFVFFPFVAVWIDENEKIVEIKKIPSWKFSIKPEKKFVKLIEIPISKKYSNVIGFLDDVRKI